MTPRPTKGNKPIADGQQRPSDFRWPLVSLALSMLLSSLGVSIANVALPTLAQAFHTSFQQVQWVVLAYLLAVTVLIVSAGRLGDILGHRRVLLAGTLLFTAASLLCGIAPTLPMLIAARAAQGLGAAILMALAMALVRETVPKARTGSAMGLLGTMSAIGTALGPSLGGILIAGLGWPAIFLVMVPVGAANFLIAYRALPAAERPAEAGRPGFDAAGTLFIGLALAAYALAATAGGGGFGRLNLFLMSAAVVAAGFFVLVERKVASPLIRLAEFQNRQLSSGLATNVLVSTVMMATLVVGPFYLSRSLGLDEALVGIVMSVGPVVSALSGVPSGRIVDRFGESLALIAGLVAMAGGSIGLALLPAQFGTAGYIAAIALLTPGYQLFQAANNTAVMIDVGPDRRGVISGMLSLSRNLGLITGASVMGAIFAFASGAADAAIARPQAVATGMRMTFIAATALIGVGIVISFVSRSGCRR